MDFIQSWPFDVVDLVWQHLDGREILDVMFKVSKGWNQHLSRSSSLKKIVISPNNNSAGLEYLLNSKRKYRHLKVVNGSKICQEIIKIIANPLNSFESIIIFRTNFNTQKQIEQIFLNSSLTLTKLELHYVTYESQGILNNEDVVYELYEFPRLRNLRIEYHIDIKPWINKYIKSFPCLESITLGNGSDSHFKSLIMQTKKLKKLTISGKFYDLNFYKDLSREMPSQLEEFIFNDILSSSQEDENLRHFNSFFTSQSKSLCRFETDALLEIDELESAFRMPRLNELYIKGFHYNIEMMDIYLENMREKELPGASLKSFSVHHMNQHLLEILALNATKLKELKVATFDAYDVSNAAWFTNLETLKIYFIDSDLKDLIMSKPESERSHFETMIISAISSLSNSIPPLMLLSVQHL